MKWVIGVMSLVAVGIALRRLLRLDRSPLPHPGAFPPLGEHREAIYRPMALELETQTAILGISLNDAIEERDADNPEIAWRLVRLSVSEWNRVAELVSGLLNTMNRYMPVVRVVVPARSMASHRFKCRVMIDYVRMHEVLDQLVFRSKLRFQLHLRVLRRAVETLSGEFRRSYRYAERSGDQPPELWNRLDLYFHDMDLVAKETLLAFRSFLICLPHTELSGFAADLKIILRGGVRTVSVPANH